MMQDVERLPRKREAGPTLLPIWFPHCPAWMCTICARAPEC